MFAIKKNAFSLLYNLKLTTMSKIKYKSVGLEELEKLKINLEKKENVVVENKIEIKYEYPKDIPTFENRNNSSTPAIKRIDAGMYYFYLIIEYGGCSCGYVGCESVFVACQKLKVRLKETEKIILTNGGTTTFKIETKKNYTEEEVVEIIKKNYNL